MVGRLAGYKELVEVRMRTVAVLAAFAIGTALANSAEAQVHVHELRYPGVACTHSWPPNSAAYSAHTVWNDLTYNFWVACPFYLPIEGDMDFVSVNVAPDLVSCVVIAGGANGQYWVYPPTSTAHFSGFDEIRWSDSSVGYLDGQSAYMECHVEPGGWISQYWVGDHNW